MELSRRRALGLAGGALLGATGALAVAGEANADVRWHRLVVATANIGRKHLDQRRRAIRDVRHAVTINGVLQRPLVGWQEIGGGDGDQRERGWIEDFFGSRYRNPFLRVSGANRQVPMSIPRTYDIVERRVTKAHDGLAKVSPSRFLNQVRLRATYDPRIQFVFVNTHYVSGAWNGELDPYEEWRDDKWRTHFRKHRDQVLAYWRGRGFPVIWVGDCNRSPMPLLLPNYEKRAWDRGIDQIGWVPGSNGTRIRFRWKKTVDMHVDGHDARVAILQVGRRV